MISVIVPIYNVEAYLEKSIRSILDNTYKDLEIICINDGSPDRCLSFLQEMAIEDSRIRIVDQKNQGVQSARNNGLSFATGDYIAFIDPDDRIHPQYFQSLLDCIEQHHADIVTCGTQVFTDDNEIILEDFDIIPYHRLSDKQFFNNYYSRHMCWGRLYRKGIVGETRFIPEINIGEDTLFNLQIISGINDPCIYETKTPLYYYRQRNGSIVRMMKYKDFIALPDWVSNNLFCDDNNKWSWMILLQAIKYALSYRYEVILRKEHENLIHVNMILNNLTRRLLKDKHIDIKVKAIHLAMMVSPQLYRYFRIKDDPSMLTWEKTVKAGTDRQ